MISILLIFFHKTEMFNISFYAFSKILLACMNVDVIIHCTVGVLVPYIEIIFYFLRFTKENLRESFYWQEC